MKRIGLMLLSLLLSTSAAFAQPKLTAKRSEAKSPLVVELTGLSKSQAAAIDAMKPDELRKTLAVYVVPSSDAEVASDAQPVFGQWEWKEGLLKFTSRFPAAPGVHYRVVARLPGDDQKVESLSISIPKVERAPSTRITAIYPTADVLPENLLKFYIHFSAPMSTGEAYKHVVLETSSGKKVELPFLEIAEELWDKSNTRLTLLLDPGRIKRGLVPREEDGPILVAGQAYRFRVKKDWPDAEGTPLVAEVVKEFSVIGADTTQPAPLEWKITPPRAGSKSPIIIDLLEPLDHAIVSRGIVVVDPQGREVEGEVSLARQEREWRFTPAAEWKAGVYELRVDDVIEDLVGNNITRPFELDRFDEVKTPEKKNTKLRVEIR